MASGRDREPLLAGGLPTQYVDVDPDETSEWLESFDALVAHAGAYRARYIMLSLLRRAAEQKVGVPSLRSTDYINTIPPEREPWFPGDEAVERRIREYCRWNAAIMVHRAQRPGIGVGGHISTYASTASIYEVGFNHFFRGKEHMGGGDQVFFQGHGSPGIYARAFLEGRISESQLDGFRQELSHPGGGLPSYPHPRLMPDFWEFPTVSMGLGPLNAIYQARFNKYLHDRGIKDTSQQRVWAFLGDGEMDEVESLGARLQDILVRAGDGALAATFGSLAAELPKVQALVASLKDASDGKIKAALNLQLNRNRALLDELARFIDGLQQAQTIDADEQDELDADEEEDTTAPRTGRAAALTAYLQAVRAQARSAASKRAVSKTSRNGKIIEWLADLGLTETDRAEVGASLLVQTNARRFVNPVKRYLDGIPKRYRAFRRDRQQAGNWYRNEGFEARDIHPLELDIVLLAILRAAGDLISRPNVQRDIDSPAWSALQPILGHYRNQVLVDEATDFSPIQLACMAALAHPRLRSFFACGDFNQRLTTWGARSADEMKWVFADFDIKEITVSYRQRKQLNELARALIRAGGGTDQNVSFPAPVDSGGGAPALLDLATDTAIVVSWLADRIREIERFVSQLPSTAIFVNAEDDVAPVAEALNEALSEHNIQVIACREGQAVGQESNVRVFDIQHIKGLEFEAVFFVGIDQLAALHPALFDKYLYVGTTRAATYLGVTCDGALPPAIESLRAHFGQDWQAPGSLQAGTEQ